MLIPLTNQIHNTGKDQILQKMDFFGRLLGSCPSSSVQAQLCSLCSQDGMVSGGTGGWTRLQDPGWGWRHLLQLGCLCSCLWRQVALFPCGAQLRSLGWVWWQFPLFWLIFCSLSESNLLADGAMKCHGRQRRCGSTDMGWWGAAQVLLLVKACAPRSFLSKGCKSQITIRAFPL